MQIRKTWKTFSLVSQVCEAEVKVGMVFEKISTIKISQAVYIGTTANVLAVSVSPELSRCHRWQAQGYERMNQIQRNSLEKKRASRADWLGFLSLCSAVWALVQGCPPIALADGILSYCLYDAGLTGMQM